MNEGTEAMVAAFVAADERDQWLYTLENIRTGMAGCPCTTTTPAIPSLGLMVGRPVRNCALCYGTGVMSAWEAVRRG